MRMVLAAAVIVGAMACEDAKPEGPAPSRFASVKKEASTKAASAFCEKQWPAAEGTKRFADIPERAIPGAPQPAPAKAGAWKWVNLWATWCHPCVEEMGLLGRWKSSLEKDGIPLNLELWSVDDDQTALTSWLAKTNMPGTVRWVRSADDLGPVLESLGADKASAIPVHALVDPAGNLRCLRVGSVHDEDYGAVKAMLSGA